MTSFSRRSVDSHFIRLREVLAPLRLCLARWFWFQSICVSVLHRISCPFSSFSPLCKRIYFFNRMIIEKSLIYTTLSPPRWIPCFLWLYLIPTCWLVHSPSFSELGSVSSIWLISMPQLVASSIFIIHGITALAATMWSACQWWALQPRLRHSPRIWRVASCYDCVKGRGGISAKVKQHHWASSPYSTCESSAPRLCLRTMHAGSALDDVLIASITGYHQCWLMLNCHAHLLCRVMMMMMMTMMMIDDDADAGSAQG